MTNKAAGPLGLLVLAAALLSLAFAVPLAAADTGDIIEPQHEPPTAADGFQAGTCTTDTPHCSPETPGQFYTQAAGHPPIGFTQYIIRHNEVEPLPGLVLKPIVGPREGRTIKTLRVDLPPGLTVNPEATPQCPVADFERVVEVAPGTSLRLPNCPDTTIVGRDEVTLVVNTPNAVPAPGGGFLPVGYVIQPTYELAGTPPGLGVGTRPPVYNLVPEQGEPALFGFVVAGKEEILLRTSVAWESDYHESFTIAEPPPSVPFSTLSNRLVNFGQDAGDLELLPGGEFAVNPEGPGNGTFITNPATCFSPVEWPHLYSTWFRAESWEEPDPNFPDGSTPVEAALPPGVEPTGCGAVPFKPGISVSGVANAVDSPTGVSVDTTLPYYTGEESEVETSHLRRAEVSMPEGMGLNPSGANGLVACTDAQFKKGVRTYDNECPAGSKIGTVAIETPPLPAGSLTGDVYVGEQQSSNPASGDMFRILVEAKSAKYGVVVRLVGHVKANPDTGRLTAVFDEQEIGPLAGNLPGGLPQAPFTSAKISFDGSKEVLTTPPTCGPNVTETSFEPWSAPGSAKHPSSGFTLTSAPGGGSCPKTLAERPFEPGYAAGPKSNVALASSPFAFHLTRDDGSQEVRRIDVTLPRGMVAKIRNLDYCPDHSIADAERETGAQAIAEPPCPDKSFLGTVTVKSGSGANPFETHGNVYFAGPYKGAPLSLVFVTPAVAGPFDLGAVIVRAGVYINPVTAQVHVVSDTIPYVFGGVNVDVRSIDVSVYRKGFNVNPTNCARKSAVVADVFGGGSNPLDAAAWSMVEKADPFRAGHCRRLGFTPLFNPRVFGRGRTLLRAAHPKFRAVLKAHADEANVRRAAFVLPHAMILDQGHIKTVCTRVQLAAHECPKASVYGYARARTPLISKVLKGPVYLVSSKHELPDLVADLWGQVHIQLHGILSSTHGRLKTVFPRVPDVSVWQFNLVMFGGKRGLLINSTNLCRAPRFGFLNLKAQNRRKVKGNVRLRIPGCHPRLRAKRIHRPPHRPAHRRR